MVVVDANTVLGGKLLKRVLGSNSINRKIIDLVMDEMQSGVIVHKNGAALVPLLGEFPFQLGKNPTLVDTIRLTETVSPGLVVAKTL